MPATADLRYRAVTSRDARFDGWFFTGVTSTGIYCRPSCPATTPRADHVRFFPTAAAAQQAGFRACRRCRPDAVPGSPEWDVRADVVGRAMRLIADGVVDREGVSGLAAALGYSVRHIHRQLVEAVGAGPLALARAQRAATARTLIERTRMPFAEVAFAAGFASVRQFNDTVARVYATTPSVLRSSAQRRWPIPVDGERGRGSAAAAGSGGGLVLRLPYRRPAAIREVLAFLNARAIAGLEEALGDCGHRRALRLPRGVGVAELRDAGDHVSCRLHLDDLRDLPAAVERCRRLLDLDADPAAVDAALAADPDLAPLVAVRPGLRVPGAADGWEAAVRAVLGQQVSVAAARTLLGRLVAVSGEQRRSPRSPSTPSSASTASSIVSLFPTPEALAGADVAGIGVPAARARTLRTLAAAVAAGAIRLDPGADRAEVAAGLAALPGIGPWTVGYVALRLGDPDAFPDGDAALVRALAGLRGRSGAPASSGASPAVAGRALAARAAAWRPWRAYATVHLWSSLNRTGVAA